MNLSLRGKILISILTITILSLLAVTGLYYRRSEQMVEKNYVSFMEEKSIQLVDELDEQMGQVYNMTVYASCDDEIKSCIEHYQETKQEASLEELGQLLYSYKKQCASVTSVYLLLPDDKMVVTSEDYPSYRDQLSGEHIEKLLQQVQQKASPMLIQDLIYEDEMLYSFAEPVTKPDGTVIAYLFSNIDERKLYYNFLADHMDQAVEKAVILDDEMRIVTGLDGERMGEKYQVEDAKASWFANQETIKSDHDHIYIYQRAGFSEVGFFAVVNKGEVLRNLRWVRRFFLVILTIAVVVASVLATYLSHVLSKPIKKLTGTMEEVSEGNLQTRAIVETKDEIGTLADAFNSMLDKIEELIAQLIEEEKQKKDIELDALQYQITPHFMYNTLNSIKYAALLKGDTQIGQVIGDFVELLQGAISKKGTFLTVAEEIHILENYIRLQEFRYGGGFEVSYEVAPEAEECLVPRLILQPLVENAFLHGMDMKEKKGLLTIRVYIEGTRLYMKVSDNGRGMSEEQIQELLNSKGKKERGFSAIGIPNIRDRLKLYYAAEGAITYESGPDGTTATIYLPVEKGEE